MLLQRKIETLTEENKQLNQENKQLSSEKTKIVQKWQNLLSRFKSEEKTRDRNKAIDEELYSAKEEMERLHQKLREVSLKNEDMQAVFSQEKQTLAQTKQINKKLKFRLKVVQEEKDILEQMNQNLSYNNQELEKEVCLLKKQLDQQTKRGSQLEAHASYHSEDLQVLSKAYKLLENQLHYTQQELQETQKSLKQKENQLLEKELFKNYSLTNAVKSLAEESQHPFRRARNSNEELTEKYEKLLSNYKTLEEEKLNFEKKYTETLSRVKAMSEHHKGNLKYIEALKKQLKEKQKTVDASEKKSCDLEEQPKQGTLSSRIETFRSKTPKLKLKKSSTPSTLSTKKCRKKSQTPDEEVTPRYKSHHCITKSRLPSQIYTDRAHWKY